MPPRERIEEPRDVIVTANMTMRDYFAAQVVAQIYEQYAHSVDLGYDEIARHAYQLADALLRARASSEGPQTTR